MIKVCRERRGRREKGTKSSKYSSVNVENLSQASFFLKFMIIVESVF